MVMALLLSAALAAPVRFERVDLISEDPGFWVNYDAPRFSSSPRVAVLRFLFQVKPVFAMPIDGLKVGISLSSQSVVYERPLARSFHWNLGLQTSLLLPRGFTAGVAWWGGPVRVGLGVSAVSSATWKRPDWTVWEAIPTVGLGVGRSPKFKDKSGASGLGRPRF